jgi:outer membrane protein assembly factor BamA
LIYTRYGFMKSPYSSQVHLHVAWSFGLSEPLVEYQHDFRGVLAGADMSIRFRWSGLDIIDFYGLGNESVPVGPTAFHRTPHKRIELATGLSFGDGSTTRFSIGPAVQYISTDTTREANYLAAVRPYGSGRFGQASLQASFEREARDRSGTPSSGYHVEGGAGYFPEFMSVDQGEFGEVHGQAAVYLSPVGTNPTLALRAQAKKLWGTYPFAEAAFLGGASSVRGLHEQRYAGDASLLGSAEIRVDVGRVSFILPSDVGLFAFGDAGRVFREGESSDRWARGWGGGLWLAPLRRSSTAQMSWARAEGRTAVYLGIGFAF